MKNLGMTESRHGGVPGGPTGRVILPVALGYHLDNRRRMHMERLTMRISSKRSGTQHHGCGNARQERSRSANVGVVAYEGDDVFSTLPPTIDQCPGPAYQKFRFKIYSLLGSTSEASIYNLNPVQDEDFVRGYKSLIAGTAVSGTRTGFIGATPFSFMDYDHYDNESLYELKFAF